MQTLDDKLTKMAQESVKTCTWNQGPTPLSSDEFYYIGQNIAYETGRTNAPNSLASMIDQWYKEKNNYDADSGSCHEGTKCRAYTQVWRGLKQIMAKI